MSKTDPADASDRPWLAGSGLSPTKVHRVFGLAGGLVVVGGVVAVNEVIFRILLDTSYVRWYLANGALITLAAGLLTFAWGDVNKLTGLISAHPLEYTAGCLALVGLPLFGFGSLLRVDRVHAAARKMDEAAIESDRNLEANWDQDKVDQMPEAFKQRLERLRDLQAEMAERAWSREPPPKGIGIVDDLTSMVLAIAFFLLCVAWLWVAAPLQYVVNLVAGAPARLALTAGSRVWYRVAPRKITVEELDADASPPEGFVETGFSAKPVTFTTLVAAGLLFLTSFLVGRPWGVLLLPRPTIRPVRGYWAAHHYPSCRIALAVGRSPRLHGRRGRAGRSTGLSRILRAGHS